jgi:hypothetical protein
MKPTELKHCSFSHLPNAQSQIFSITKSERSSLHDLSQNLETIPNTWNLLKAANNSALIVGSSIECPSQQVAKIVILI